MYLASIKLKNFRKFDDKDNIVTFKKGLNVLVGENDAGKSAIIDAIRLVLGTTDNSWYRIKPSDYYREELDRRIDIVCEFRDLTEVEQAVFLEYLTYENKDKSSTVSLYLHNSFAYSTTYNSSKFLVRDATGRKGNGAPLSSNVKEYLRATYLKPLRDAAVDMQSGRKSRLAQIIHGMPNVNDGESEYKSNTRLEDLSLVGIFNLTNQLLGNHSVLTEVNKNIANLLTEKMLLKNDRLQTKIEVSDSGTSDEQKIGRLLEKLDLTIDKSNNEFIGNIGLGTSNIISMACEMLLHKANAAEGKSAILLIEEPEAHIHAQRQLKLIQSLNDKLSNSHQQIIMTTHSPLLVSVVSLNNLIVVKNAGIYSMALGNTLLEKDDYRFLEAYLDATKANLFFARSVIIVEGPAEELLFPTIAKLLGRSFTDFGCSMVDARGTGLKRFARIFQRTDIKKQFPVHVACVTDKDIMPNCAPAILWPDACDAGIGQWSNKPNRKWKAEADFDNDPERIDKAVAEIKAKTEGQYVKTFVSNKWTLEYDLAFYGLKDNKMGTILKDCLMKLAYKQANKKQDFNEIIEAFESIEEKASYFYKFFYGNKVSKAEFAQELALRLEESFRDEDAKALRKVLPPYIVNAIDYVTGD